MIHVLPAFFHGSFNYNIFTASFASTSRNYVVIRSRFVFPFGRHTWYFSRSRRSFWKGDAAKCAERERIKIPSFIRDEARRGGKRGNCTCMNGTWLFDSIIPVSPLSVASWNYVCRRSRFTPLPGFTMPRFQIRDTLTLIQRR